MPPEAAGVAAAGTKPGVDLLFVSQFTLYGSVRKGTKPDFSGAAPPDSARSTYTALLDRVREAYEPERVKDGVFGAMMKVRMGCCLRSLSVFLFCFSTTLPPNPTGGSRQRWPRHPHPGLEGRQDASLQSIEQTERESDFLCYTVSNTFFSPRQQHAVQRMPARHGQQLVSGPTRHATTCRQEFHQHGWLRARHPHTTALPPPPAPRLAPCPPPPRNSRSGSRRLPGRQVGQPGRGGGRGQRVGDGRGRGGARGAAGGDDGGGQWGERGRRRRDCG